MKGLLSKIKGFLGFFGKIFIRHKQHRAEQESFSEDWPIPPFVERRKAPSKKGVPGPKRRKTDLIDLKANPASEVEGDFTVIQRIERRRFSLIDYLVRPTTISLMGVILTVGIAAYYFYHNLPEINEDIPQKQQIVTKIKEEQENSESDANPLFSQFAISSAKSNSPQISIVLTHVGRNFDQFQQVLSTLPSTVTLAFSPYASQVGDMISDAKDLGFCCLMEVPLESFDYPLRDTGYLTLLTGVASKNNISTLNSIFSLSSEIEGVIGEGGSRFLASSQDLATLIEAVQSHSLYFVDPNSSLHTQTRPVCRKHQAKCYSTSLTIPEEISSQDLKVFLQDIENIAKDGENLIISIPISDMVIDMLGEWIDTLEGKGFQVVPVSQWTV
jgi:polysaccharide deacetylase 2 family uncharacterized protein YibQ